MKRVIVLVLLQICFCYELNISLNGEIIQSLLKLKNLPNLMSTNVSVPGQHMRAHPSSCVGTFSRELEIILKNMTTNVRKGSEHMSHLQNLLANLKELGKNQDDVPGNCSMTLKARGKNNTWTSNYITFLRKLNTKR